MRVGLRCAGVRRVRRGIRADQQHRFADGIEGGIGADDRQVHAEEPARQPAGGLRDRRAAADRPRLSRHEQRPRNDAAGGRGCRAAQRQRDPGGEPDSRRFQSESPADVRDPGRGQQRAGDVVRSERAARREAAGRAEVRRGAARRRSAHASRRRLPARPRRRGPYRRRSVRQRDGDRHPPAGQGADRRFRQDVAAAQPRAPSRRPGLRYAGAQRGHVHAGPERADDRRAEGAVGSIRRIRPTTASSSR